MDLSETSVDHQLLHATLVLGGVVEARDAYTGGHLWRVAQYGKLLGQRLGLDRPELYAITLGGYVHDLGKIGIPDRVLGKRGPLSDDEFAIIKTHPIIGSDLLRKHPLGALLTDVVRHHHERRDGTGYPDGIGGDEIGVGASVIGVADVFDALTSSRPYRKGMPVEKALSILEEMKGTHHRPDHVDAFREVAQEGGLDPILLHSSRNRAMIDCLPCGPIVVMPADAKPGDLTSCPACRDEFCVVTDADGNLTAEVTGRKAGADLARPQADVEGIAELIRDMGVAA